MEPAQIQALGSRLDVVLAQTDSAARIREDPVGIVRGYRTAADREVAGLVASTLAFGNVRSIRQSVDRALARLDGAPADVVGSLGLDDLRARLHGFVHRVYRGADVAHMLSRAGELIRLHGTLGSAFARMLGNHNGDLRAGLAEFAGFLRGAGGAGPLQHLLPDPMAGSACKRLLLYLRWMVRPDDGVDLGCWQLSPAILLVPLDTHVHRISRNLGLTARATPSWKAAEEVTAALRMLDARDPVKYDFALCHLGISRRCPSRRDAQACGLCAVRAVCAHWAVQSRPDGYPRRAGQKSASFASSS